VDEGLVEKRRGRGMFIMEGAKKALLAGERELFLNEQWPSVVATIRRLGLNLDDLVEIARPELEETEGDER
jgi:GntR family transcriptional regulator